MLVIPLSPGSFRWPYNGMLSDLRAAIGGKANLLTALGLLIYTEVLGNQILRAQGVKKPGGERSFYCFAEEYMSLSSADMVYEHYRHGLAHLHQIIRATQATVAMRADPDWVPDSSTKAIQATAGGKEKELHVNAYWRDFQRGLAKAGHKYPQVFLV